MPSENETTADADLPRRRPSWKESKRPARRPRRPEFKPGAASLIKSVTNTKRDDGGFSNSRELQAVSSDSSRVAEKPDLSGVAETSDPSEADRVDARSAVRASMLAASPEFFPKNAVDHTIAAPGVAADTANVGLRWNRRNSQDRSVFNQDTELLVPAAGTENSEVPQTRNPNEDGHRASPVEEVLIFEDDLSNTPLTGANVDAGSSKNPSGEGMSNKGVSTAKATRAARRRRPQTGRTQFKSGIQSLIRSATQTTQSEELERKPETEFRPLTQAEAEYYEDLELVMFRPKRDSTPVVERESLNFTKPDAAPLSKPGNELEEKAPTTKAEKRAARRRQMKSGKDDLSAVTSVLKDCRKNHSQKLLAKAREESGPALVRALEAARELAEEVGMGFEPADLLVDVISPKAPVDLQGAPPQMLADSQGDTAPSSINESPLVWEEVVHPPWGHSNGRPLAPAVAVSMIPKPSRAQVIDATVCREEGWVPESYHRPKFALLPPTPPPRRKPPNAVVVGVAEMLVLAGHGGLTQHDSANDLFKFNQAIGSSKQCKRSLPSVLGTASSPNYVEILAQKRLLDWQLAPESVAGRGVVWDPGIHTHPAKLLQFSYEELRRGRFGPAADDPEKLLRADSFGFNLHAEFGQCENHVVDLPSNPLLRVNDKGKGTWQELNPKVDSAGDLIKDSAHNLAMALHKNIKTRETMLKEVVRMRRAIPSAPGEEDDRTNDSADEGFHTVELTIRVIKGEHFPEPHYMYSRDAYVSVHVVDADPLSLEAENVEWYAERQQWASRTLSKENSLNPVWDAVLTTGETGVRPRAGTWVHFRVLDKDDAALQDTPIGQAAIPMTEVLKDVWYTPKVVALTPFGTNSRPVKEVQQDWKSLREARLYISIQYEGVNTSIKSKVAWADTGGRSKSKLQSRRDRRKGGQPSANAKSSANGSKPGTIKSKVAWVDKGGSSKSKVQSRRDRRKG